MSNEQEHLRLRRTQSVTRAEEITKEEQKVRSSQPDKPCHKPRDSLFSWTSEFNNFTGFVNWAFLLLCIGGFRLLLENFIRYGIRIDPIEWFYVFSGKGASETGEHPSVILILYVFVPIVFCLITEKGLAVEIIPSKPGMIAHAINLLVLVLIPMVSIHVKNGFSLFGASVVSFVYSVLFLKLWSYVQVNMWCRSIAKSKGSKGSMRRQSLSYSSLPNKKSDLSSDLNGSIADDLDNHNISNSHGANPHQVMQQYPANLNLRDLLYFLAAPTLCYELNFPRTQRIRKRFLLKRILEVLIGCQLMLMIIQQYIIPSVKNSLIPFSNMDVAKATERLLKLAIPNHLFWLCMFYIVFHSSLNLVGELLQFADRNFYSDWWNANNIETFWRNWNLPVHRWAVRHLYIPLVGMGYSKGMVSVVVFFVSAFFHEYLVSVPLKTFKIWAFMGMMAQVPLSYISRFMEKKIGPRFGNLVVWASIIMGQPLCIMIYYHDYVITHFGKSLMEEYSHV